jgi:hypothetical protein
MEGNEENETIETVTASFLWERDTKAYDTGGGWRVEGGGWRVMRRKKAGLNNKKKTPQK